MQSQMCGPRAAMLDAPTESIVQDCHRRGGTTAASNGVTARKAQCLTSTKPEHCAPSAIIARDRMTLAKVAILARASAEEAHVPYTLAVLHLHRH